MAVGLAGALLATGSETGFVARAAAAPREPAASAPTTARGTGNLDAQTGARLGALPASSLSSLPAGTLLPVPDSVLSGLSGLLQIPPAVLSAVPIDQLVGLVAPTLLTLPAATLVGLRAAVMSALPLASVVGLLGPVVGASGGTSSGAAIPSTTSSTARATTRPAATAGPAVMAAARSRTPSPGPVGSRCTAARNAVETAGLTLPPQFEYRCPGSTEAFTGDRQHWGTACFAMSLCPTSAYIAINPGLIGPSEARLRYVVAHETCHALDAVARRPLDEAAADACAAGHGFARV